MTITHAGSTKQKVPSRHKSLLSHSLQVCLAIFVASSQPLMPQTNAPTTGIQKEAPMAAGATPAFEVAAIRPSDPNDPKAANGWNCESEGHRLECRQATLLDLLSITYGLQPRQIVGGPTWLNQDRYDISGIPDIPGIPSPAQTREMYKRLLAERFGLVLHRDTREMSIYALTIAKGGPLLKPASPDEPVNTGNSGDRTQRTVRFTNMSMQEFARNLTLYEDRPVVDRTALPGHYDFTLRWTYALLAEEQPDAPPSIFTAIKEQLGLQLNALKGPGEVIVIDHLEKPHE